MALTDKENLLLKNQMMTIMIAVKLGHCCLVLNRRYSLIPWSLINCLGGCSLYCVVNLLCVPYCSRYCQLIPWWTHFLVLLFGACATWFFVVSAPMAKVHWRLFQIGFAKPLHISVIQGYGQVNSASVLLNVYRAFSRKYLSYTLFGTVPFFPPCLIVPLGVNIFFVNCLPLVFIRTATLLFGLFTQHELLPPLVSFFFDIFCTIPITFYIGLSIEWYWPLQLFLLLILFPVLPNKPIIWLELY